MNKGKETVVAEQLPKDVHDPVPRTCEYVMSHGGGTSQGSSNVQILKWEIVLD